MSVLATALAVLQGLVTLAAAQASAAAPGPIFPNTSKICNKWYLAKDGDDCSAALRAGGSITMAQFLTWNPDVSSDCARNFWPGNAYCIGVASTWPNTAANCAAYHVVMQNSGDSCWSISQKYGITEADFFRWNPDVRSDCGANFWPDYAYCVAVAQATTSTTHTSVTTTSGPTTARTSTTTKSSATASESYSIRHPVVSWNITTPTIGTGVPPAETQAGQPSYCIEWHLVAGADTCRTIVNRYQGSLNMDSLLDWNPGLLDDCSGLQLGYWVCVRIQSRSSLTLTFNPTPGEVPPAGTSHVPETFTPLDPSFTPSPTQGPLPPDCENYYLTQPDDRCDAAIQSTPGLTRERFFELNPYLAGNCGGLWAGHYYCVRAGGQGQGLPEPPTVTASPSPAAPGGAANCRAWYRTSGGDSCDLVVAMFGRFDLASFVAWNPSVRADCSGIKDDLYYCVAVPGTPTTRTDPIPSWVPGPTGVSTSTGGVPPTTTSTTGRSTTTTSGAATTTSGGAIATPQPVQDGMVQGCRRFYFVIKDDGCWAIANAAGINLSDFYVWNPAVKNDCSGLQASVYVCLGTAGPVTTISGGPPVPTK